MSFLIHFGLSIVCAFIGAAIGFVLGMRDMSAGIFAIPIGGVVGFVIGLLTVPYFFM